MAPKQKTFELIPDPIGLPLPLPGPGPGPAQQAAAVANKPPMTTKQAKKLYRQKNKGPKISKAEQRRIDLMEQDRIRKEFEKEKAQARARTARERKKEKEEKEKEAKRRKGLPLVDVHPSQDTISKFISRLGFASKSGSCGRDPILKTVQETETETETVTEANSDTDTDGGDVHEAADEDDTSEKENLEPDDDPRDRPAKRRRLTQPKMNLLDRMIHIPSQRSASAVARLAQELGMESRPRASSADTDDPATESMLEDQLIADVELASSKSMTNSSPMRERHVKEAAPINVPAQKHIYAAPTVPHQARPLPPNPPSRHQEPQPVIPPIKNSPQEPKSAVPGHVRGHHGGGIFKKPTSPFIPRPQQKPTIKPPATGVPSAPPSFRAPVAPQTSTFARPKFLPRRVQVPSRVPVQASPSYAGSRRSATEAANTLPTSTQLLVLNHADELFPSASQEAQELFEEQHPAARAEEIASPPSLARRPLEPPVKTPAAPRSGLKSNNCLLPMPLQRNQLPPLARDVAPEFPFMSTQDFVLSSQDLMELETPCKVREDQGPQKTNRIEEGDDLATTSRGFHASGRHVTELQAPTESVAPALPPTTSNRTSYGLGGRRSYLATRDATVIRANESRGQYKQASYCPSQVHNSPQLKYPDSSSIRCQPPRSAMRTTASPQESCGKADTGDQSNHPRQASSCTPSSCRSVSSTKSPQTNTLSETKNATNRAQDCIVTPQDSPPKKRMFGSSGPGAEVLIAMERSYKQNLQEQRRREEDLRVQERNRRRESEQLARELADVIDGDDELPDSFLGEDTESPQPIHEGVGAARDLDQITIEKPNGTTKLTASQETDYGDFDFGAGEELGILTDMGWVDDDLDGF